MVGRISGRIGLNIDQLENESWSLYAVVMAKAGLSGTGPGEMNMIQAGLFNFCNSAVRDARLEV